jgi:hypothetical protein
MEMEMSKLLLVLDVGSGFVKYMGLTEKAMASQQFDESDVRGFKTAVGPARAGLIQPGHKPLIMEFDDSSFFVGQTAEIALPPEQRTQSLSKQWAFEKGNRALVYYALERALTEAGIEPSADPIPVSMVTGLPQEYFSEGADSLKKEMLGIHNFRFKDRIWRVEIERVDVVPQAMGAYYYAASSVLTEEESEQRIGVIDIGTYTSDFCLSEGINYRAYESGGASIGISALHEDLRRGLLAETGIKYSDESIEKAFRTRHVLMKGASLNVDGFIENAMQGVGENLLKSIPRTWQIDDMHIILAGGGAQAHYFAPFFAKKIPHIKIIDKTPFNTIVLGYAIYGLSQLNA